jgi:hypothetical protein
MFEFFEVKSGGPFMAGGDPGAVALNVVCNAGLVAGVSYALFRAVPNGEVVSRIAKTVSYAGAAGLVAGIGMLGIVAWGMRGRLPI